MPTLSDVSCAFSDETIPKLFLSFTVLCSLPQSFPPVAVLFPSHTSISRESGKDKYICYEKHQGMNFSYPAPLPSPRPSPPYTHPNLHSTRFSLFSPSLCFLLHFFDLNFLLVLVLLKTSDYNFHTAMISISKYIKMFNVISVLISFLLFN